MQKEISNPQKAAINIAISNLMEVKVRKATEKIRVEEGDFFIKMPNAEYFKYVAKVMEEADDIFKECLRKIYKEQGKEAMYAFIAECKEYTNEDFLKDISPQCSKEDFSMIQNLVNKYASPI